MELSSEPSIHSVVQNPSLAKQLFGYAILGFALTEAIASFAPMMAFLILFIFQIGLRFSKIQAREGLFHISSYASLKKTERTYIRSNQSCYRINILLYNGKSNNKKFSSAGKQSFIDMGAYSAVAGL
ncbi:hypothetical protein H5410_051169, partial [Solanum commersonii]